MLEVHSSTLGVVVRNKWFILSDFGSASEEIVVYLSYFAGASEE